MTCAYFSNGLKTPTSFDFFWGDVVEYLSIISISKCTVEVGVFLRYFFCFIRFPSALRRDFCGKDDKNSRKSPKLHLVKGSVLVSGTGSPAISGKSCGW